MDLRFNGAFVLAALLMVGAPAAAQQAPEIPQDLQQTYGAFATALVEGRAGDAIEHYAEDAVVLVHSVNEVIRSKFPAVLKVVMQPVVGAPEGGAVTAGPEPKVVACDQFRDALGHLTQEGAEHVRESLRDHYRATRRPARTEDEQRRHG